MIYSALASIYDRLMAHVDYQAWVKLIDKIAKKYGRREMSIFEIGGGTGTLGLALQRIGYLYYGSDRSFEMVKEARKKGLRFFVADICNLPVATKFDMVIFLYDGINYIQKLRHYTKAFIQVANILNEGGLFLFDITTEYNSKKYFLNYIEYNDYGDSAYFRHSYYDKLNKEQFNDFIIFKRLNGRQQYFGKHTEHHVQKVYEADTITQYIPYTHFEVLGIWDGFSFRGYHKKSERIHFLLGRKNSKT